MSNRDKLAAAAVELRNGASQLYDLVLASPAPSLSTTELPELCERELPSDPNNPDLVLCELSAWLLYLARYIDCQASINPYQCAVDACNNYHDDATACESEYGV